MLTHGVNRIELNGQRCIRKPFKTENEQITMEYLMSHSFRIPRLFGVEEREDGKRFLLMEDVGTEHLEVHADLFTAAFESLLQVRTLQFDTGVAPITTSSLLQTLATGPDLRFISEAFGWERSRSRMLREVWEWIQQRGTFGEPLVFSHGDYHPRNIMVGENGQVITIDWEKAGYHSVFLDLYALLHMAYPDREAALISSEKERLFHVFAERLGILEMQDGYRTFFYLNRLYELVQIRKDLQTGNRLREQLLAQAESVYDDLTARFQASTRYLAFDLVR